MSVTVKDSLTVQLWPVVSLCVQCWKVQVMDKQVCAECAAKGATADKVKVDVSYPKINHVSVTED